MALGRRCVVGRKNPPAWPRVQDKPYMAVLFADHMRLHWWERLGTGCRVPVAGP